MNISQFLKSLGLEHLRDIFETEQVNSCVLLQLSSCSSPHLVFLFWTLQLFISCIMYSLCSTICLVPNLFLSDMFLPCLLAACGVSREAREPSTLYLSPTLPGSLESYLSLCGQSCSVHCHMWLDHEKRECSRRVLRSRNFLNNFFFMLSEVFFFFVSKKHWHLCPHLILFTSENSSVCWTVLSRIMSF